MRFLIPIIISILMLSSGCKPLANLSPSSYPFESIEKKDFQKLNGVYKNYQDTVFGNIIHEPYRGRDENDRKLLQRLFVFSNNDKIYSDSVKLEFEFTSSKRAIIKGYKRNNLVYERKIHGRFKKGYFYIRPKIIVFPLVPLLFGYVFERVRIGKSENDLIVDHTAKVWVFAFVAGGLDKGLSTSIYKNTKE